VAYAISWLNIRCTSAVNTNVSLRVLFTGIKPNFKKDLKAAFGNHVAAYEATDNMSNAHTCICIAMYPDPKGTATGEWVLWKLSSISYIQQTHFFENGHY